MVDTTGDEDREVIRDDSIIELQLISKQRLKAALWYAVGQIVDEESLSRNRNATPQFIGALTELVWTQIGRSPLFLAQKIRERWLTVTRECGHGSGELQQPRGTLNSDHRRRVTSG
jgi:hypothetical protein